MPYRIGVKPGKAASVVGMVAGGLFVLLGIAVVIPLFGAFGFVWTAFAALISLYYVYNLFSEGGASAYQVDIDSPSSIEDLDTSLRKLAKLKEDGLISEEEYQRKRDEVMRRG